MIEAFPHLDRVFLMTDCDKKVEWIAKQELLELLTLKFWKNAPSMFDSFLLIGIHDAEKTILSPYSK
jgi:hypothetical protein